MKHTPATPLPVKYTGHCFSHAEGHLFFPDASKACTITLTGAASMTQAELDSTASYFEHAANAYPRLVEALRKLCPEPAYYDALTNEQRTARALLRELGETE